MAWTDLIGFPATVNETAARVVAAGVALTGTLALVTGWHLVVVVMALGFLARVVSGPTLSPLGQLATRIVAPRFGEPRPVAGRPKRFAQSIGLVMTATAATLGLALGWDGASAALVAVLVGFASVEAALGLCAGCWAFGLLMRARLIPEDACAACADISLRNV